MGEKPEQEKQPAPEMTLAPELFTGIAARLGGSDNFQNQDIAGLTFGVGAWFAPTRLYSLGLQYQRTGLGSGGTAPNDNSVTAHYDLNTIWAGGRAYPVRNDSFGLFVALNLGASWQNIDANGTRTTSTFTTPVATFHCSASDGPNFALGAGFGVDVDLDRHLAFIAQAEAGAHQLTSDMVNGCAPGAGSVTNIGARIGFEYRFDLDELKSKATASASSRHAF